MAYPKLGAEAVWIVRRNKAQRSAPSSRNHCSAGNYDNPATRHVDVSDLLYCRTGRDCIEVAQALLIELSPIPGADSPPTSRINLGANQKLYRIVIESIRRM